jgi:restriction system protein
MPKYQSQSILPEDHVEQMTPAQFELSVKEYIEALGRHLPDFKVTHNAHVTGTDGVYQVDVLASYTALGVNMVVLIECKRYALPVSREKVQVLYDKIRSVGAHKGILFSTCGFQNGAIEYALRHKIALIILINARIEHITNSLAKPRPRSAPKPPAPPRYIGEYINEKMICYVKPEKMDGLVDYLNE